MKSRIAKIKNKYYDIETRNKSFLMVAHDLHELGIKNYYFMLEIKDYSLININPYAVDESGNTTLTEEEISRILIECASNPWYFLREIIHIPDQGGSFTNYKANRGNIAQAYCIWKGYDSWLCLPRQTGKTMSALAFQAWMYIFGTTNSQFIFIHLNGEGSKNNLKCLRDLIDALPQYMRPKSIMGDDGKRIKAQENATKIANPINKNSIITKSKATSYDSALSLARGLTAPVLYFDEPEFTEHIKTIVANSVSTYKTAAANAKRNNAMYGRIFTCTPGDLDTPAGMEAQEILDKTAKWTEKIYDMDKEQYDQYIASHGMDCNKILYIEYSYIQIGKTDKWLQDISAEIGDPLTVRREILLQRLHGSSNSPFAQEDIEYIVQMEQKPIDELWLLDYFKFDIYKRLERQVPYMIGVDCSSGTGGDNNAITILDPRTVQPVAEFESSYIGETAYENLIKALMKIIPRSCIIIERNSMGDAIIDHFLHSSLAGRLYFDKAKNLIEDEIKSSETVESMLKKQSVIKTYYGVYTNVKSRDAMMQILARHVNEYKEKFVTHNITRDISRLVRKTNGRIEAGPGFHDDSVMSYLIALYVYYHGNNLAMFGISREAQQDDLDNSGLYGYDNIDNLDINPHAIEDLKSQEQKEENTKKELQWNRIMADAIKKSQKQTAELYKKNQIQNSVYEATPDSILNDYDSDEEDIPLDFFTEINNM